MADHWQDETRGAVIASTKLLTRVQVLHMRVGENRTLAEVTALTGVSVPDTNQIVRRALARGMDPDARPFVIQPEWVADAPKSGRHEVRDRPE